MKIEPIVDVFIKPEIYNNLESFLDIDTFSRCDSAFNIVSTEELQAAVKNVQLMKENGTLNAWFDRIEEVRKKIGQSSTVYAIKK